MNLIGIPEPAWLAMEIVPTWPGLLTVLAVPLLPLLGRWILERQEYRKIQMIVTQAPPGSAVVSQKTGRRSRSTLVVVVGVDKPTWTTFRGLVESARQ